MASVRAHVVVCIVLSQLVAVSVCTTTVYTRWGRKDCPSGANLIYSGYTSGTTPSEGSASNLLCLPENPQYGRFADYRWGGAIYGARYKMQGQTKPYSSQLQDHYAYCAVCQTSKHRSSVFMYPARLECPSGWHTEYHGYLLSPHYQQARGEYNCFDDQPQGHREFSVGGTGYELFRVGAERNAGLPACYSYARELTCCVCSK